MGAHEGCSETPLTANRGKRWPEWKSRWPSSSPYHPCKLNHWQGTHRCPTPSTHPFLRSSASSSASSAIFSSAAASACTHIISTGGLCWCYARVRGCVDAGGCAPCSVTCRTWRQGRPERKKIISWLRAANRGSEAPQPPSVSTSSS
jgi:hypothetical protein